MVAIFLGHLGKTKLGQAPDAYPNLVDQFRVLLFAFGFFLFGGGYVFARVRVNKADLRAEIVELDDVLLSDLKRCGMLDDTALLSGSEKVGLGRAPKITGSAAGSRV